MSIKPYYGKSYSPEEFLEKYCPPEDLKKIRREVDEQAAAYVQTYETILGFGCGERELRLLVAALAKERDYWKERAERLPNVES